MADIVVDGNVRISWVSTISNTAAPTTAELGAGVALESFLMADGVEWGTESGEVETSPLNSTQNTALVGRRTDSISLTMKQQGKTAAPWTTFASTPSGYLVIRRAVAAATAWTATQKVTVAPCQAGFRSEVNPAANSLDKFTVKFAITGPVVDTATVA